MSRKGKDGSELEYYRGMVRQQAKLIKHLQKQLARASKQLTKNVTVEDQFVGGEEVEEPTVGGCSLCSKSLNSIDLGKMIIYTCSCGYRKVERNE